MSDPKGYVFSDPDQDPAERERLYPELGRANLLRLRGDYDGAVHQCLSVLKRMPDDIDAHVLVADIFAESGDLNQAAQWYDLALEIEPGNRGIKQKLEKVKERSSHRDIAETAEQLGLPPDTPHMGMIAGGVAALVLLISIASFVLGQKNSRLGTEKTLRVPITAPPKMGSGTPDSVANKDASNDIPAEKSPLVPSASGQSGLGVLAQEDRSLTVTLSERTPLGMHISTVSEDPRSKVVILTYTVRPDEDARKIGSELAKAALDQVTDAITITLRGIRNEKLSYIADVSRDSVTSAYSAANNAPDTASDAYLSKVLSNEWSAPNPTTNSTPGNAAPTSNDASAITSTGTNTGN